LFITVKNIYINTRDKKKYPVPETAEIIFSKLRILICQNILSKITLDVKKSTSPKLKSRRYLNHNRPRARESAFGILDTVHGSRQLHLII